LTCGYEQATPTNKAKNVIFVLMTGAPSHVDMFDLKALNGTTPSNFKAAEYYKYRWRTVGPVTPSGGT
jgi:hypothetical protein